MLPPVGPTVLSGVPPGAYVPAGRITDRRQHSSPAGQPQGDDGAGKGARGQGRPRRETDGARARKKGGVTPALRFVWCAQA